MRKLKLDGYFHAYVGGDEVKIPKPNPEGFLKVENLLERALKVEKFSKDQLGFFLNAENTHIFLCGDSALIGAPVKLGGGKYEYPDYGLVCLLKSFGFEQSTRFQPGNMSYESYW